MAFPTYTLTPLDNAGPVTYKLNSGALPPGLTISTGGIISGTPTAAGSYGWQVQYTDGVDTEYRSFTINVYAIDITTPGQLPNAPQNASYSVTLSASGGAGGYTFTSGGLPNGLTLNPNGTISGTVTAGPGRWSFAATATDANGTSYTKQMAIEVTGGTQFPVISLYGSGGFDDCTIGVGCGRNGEASGGIATYSWIASGLPPGMSIRFGSGVTSAYVTPGDFELWGTPTALGTFDVQLTAIDANGAATTAMLPLKVSSLAIDFSTELPNGTLGGAYSNKFRVLGGSGPYSASLTGGELADGLSLNSGGLVVSGTPMENGNLFATFEFADTASHTLQMTNYYTISAAQSGTTIGTNSNLGTWSIGSNVQIYLYACCGSSYVWTVTGGEEPPGITLSPSGVLTGMPTAVGVYTFLVEAADTAKSTNVGFRQFTITVTSLILISAPTLPYGNLGAAYSQTLTTAGGTGALNWALAPFSFVPPGLSLSPIGTISGTPLQMGQFQFTVTATDSAGNTGSWVISLAIYPTPQTRYVSPTGSDANPGALAQPYLTIQKCATAVFGGSTCLIRAGSYHESVTPNSGITIVPYNGESVVVDGTDPVTNWSPYQGSIYSANVTLLDDDMNQLFVGTQMMTEARWPNGGDLFHVNWATLGAGTSDSQLIDSNLPSADWTGAKVHLLSGQDPWSPQTATVTASSPGQLTITLDDLDYPPYILPQAGGRYYLYRSLNALDVPSEWFYDPSKQTLYFWAPENLNPNGLNVRAKRRVYGFDLSGRSGVTIQNIALFACGINMSTSSANNIIDGLNGLYLFHFTDMPAVSASNPTGYWYTHVMDSGIVLNGSGNVLRNSTITWSAGNGVTLQGSGNTVTNNLILNTGYAGNQGGGAISLFGTQHTVRNNTMRFSGRSLATIYPFPVNPDYNDVGYNNLWNAMMLGLDGGAIYSGNANVTGTRIHHNWVHDTNTPIQFPGMYTRNGIYIDENASGFEVDQNVVWNNEFLNIFLHGHTSGVATPFNNYIHNNSIPDVSADGNIELQGPILCGTTQIQDNFVLLPVLQVQMTTPCPASNNDATAPGATDMTPSVQVGCNFAGCSSPAPPAVSGTTVGASIEVEPLSAAAGAGQAATFSVIAAGSPPLAYQWLRNGVVIPGATGAAYTTPATSLADNGAVFTVQVSNALDSVTSSPAVLTIGTTPAFFAGEVSLGSNVEYLQFPDNNVFGYYTFVANTIFYHFDLGYEAFIANSSGTDIYLYDFTSAHWWYTDATTFPYLYDFALSSWIYYFPNTTSPGHYTTSPRYFSNLTTAQIFTM